MLPSQGNISTNVFNFRSSVAVTAIFGVCTDAFCFLQMHHPIQMKPADSEKRNGESWNGAYTDTYGTIWT